jgi:hypothetical protein
MADKYLVINDSKESCKGYLGFIEACIGWFVHIFNPKTSVHGTNLLVDFDFKGGGYVKARAHLHCGPTPWVQVGVSAAANPARLTTSFFTKGGHSIGMSAGARPFTIDWHVQGVPFPINLIIELILDFLSDVLVYIVSLFGVRWTRTLIDIPSPIPGTSIPAVPSLDNAITNYNGDLTVTGNIRFP